MSKLTAQNRLNLCHFERFNMKKINYNYNLIYHKKAKEKEELLDF